MRTVFFETLRPPEGYRLDEAIATTYTLDLITLLTAPLAFTTFEWSDADGKPTSDPVLLLEALRRSADKLTVFCQAGRTVAPSQQGILYSFLEPIVVEVMAPLGGAFHPKLWLMRFVNDNDEPIIRLVVLSRNLTADRCWDTSLVMDGKVADRKLGFAAHAQLAELIQALPGLAVRPPGPQVVARANRLADEVRRADFTPPEGFDVYQFFTLGLRKSRRLPFPVKHGRMLVVSPFLTKGFLEDLAEGTSGNVLVSRMEELATIPKKTLEPFGQIYVLADAAHDSDGTEEPPSIAAPGAVLSGLHAKLYLVDEGWDSTLFVGSANATTAGFARNVEVLVGLTGKKSKVGVDRTLAKSEGESSLLDLLALYQPPEVPVVPDAIAELLEETLDTFRLAMATADLRAVVERADAGFLLHLAGTELVKIPAGVSASLWPITIPEEANAQRLGASHPSPTFGPVPLAAVTSFFAVVARAAAEGKSLEIRFTVNLPLENVPSGRREAVLGTLLDDPEKFLRFLQFLLGDLDELGPQPTGNPADPFKSGAWGSSQFALCESLLQALKNDPRRLDHIATAVAELTALENGAERLPPGFLSVWEPIWAARRELVT